MNIASTQFSLSSKSFEIYLSGCDGACSESCHNRELWNFNIGDDYADIIDNIIEKIKDFDLLIDNVWILGGEPLLQDTKLLHDLISTIANNTNKKIWLWTRFELEKIPNNIKSICDYIKTGCYDEKLLDDNYTSNGIKLATNNQRICTKGVNY